MFEETLVKPGIGQAKLLKPDETSFTVVNQLGPNIFRVYTMECLMSQLALLRIHTSLKMSVYVKKMQVTSGMFQRMSQEALHNYLGDE